MSAKFGALFVALIGVAILVGRSAAADKDNPKDVFRVASANDGIVAQVAVKEGQAVKRGDLLVRLDDRILQARLDIQKAKLAASKADLDTAEKTRDEAKHRYQTFLELVKRKAIPADDGELRAAKLVSERYVAEVVSRTEAVKLAEAELRLAEITLDTYTIRSPVDGTVVAILVKAGEAAKALEPVVFVRQGDAK